MMSRLAAAVAVGLLALVAQPTGAFAQDEAGAAPTGEQVADAISFATNNAYRILYHEIGHLFVGELGLPVLGKDEDAADSLAAVFLLEDADEWADEVLRDAAEGWRLRASESTEELTDLDFMDEHSLDKQRAFALVCMMVGNNPEYYGELATEFGMDAAKQESCGYQYRQAADAWAQLLAPHEQDEDTPPVGKITFEYGDPGEYVALAEALKAESFLEEAAEMVNENYVIPRDLVFRAKQCGDANAYYAPGDAEVAYCYEYAKYLYDIYLASLANPGGDKAEPEEADAQ